MLDPAVEIVLRGGLASLLLSTALHKLRDLDSFRAAVIGYALVPERSSGVVAAALASGEAAIGAAVLAPASFGVRAGALVAAASLLALYGAAIALNLARGRRDIDCGCAGLAARQPLSEWLLARNAALVAIALALVGGVSPRSLVWIDVLTVSGGVAMLAALWLAAHRLLANAPLIARLREGST